MPQELSKYIIVKGKNKCYKRTSYEYVRARARTRFVVVIIREKQDEGSDEFMMHYETRVSYKYQKYLYLKYTTITTVRATSGKICG